MSGMTGILMKVIRKRNIWLQVRKMISEKGSERHPET
jgi:hypothetical protein